MSNTQLAEVLNANRVLGERSSSKSITTTYKGGESRLTRYCKANGLDVNNEEHRKAFQRHINAENAKLQALVSAFSSEGLVFDKVSQRVDKATDERNAVTIRMVRPTIPKVKEKKGALPKGIENLSAEKRDEFIKLWNLMHSEPIEA